MAYSPSSLNYEKVSGLFIEKEFGKRFEYTNDEKIVTMWDRMNGCEFRVFVGPLGETRPANILKTVAYVMVDEDKVEKWNIKHEWRREENREEI